MIKRNKFQKIEDLPLPSDERIQYLSKTLTKQVEFEIFKNKYTRVADILKIVGTGALLAASFAVPNLPVALKPFLTDSSEYEAWKRFNIPYLKRTLKRLEKKKLVEIGVEGDMQVVKITDRGKRRILKYALDEIAIKKPKVWDGSWRLVSYDFPKKYGHVRNIFREYLVAWGFNPFYKSVYLHAFPCEKEVDFLREYLGLGEYVRILKVSAIENSKIFRDFFGV